MSTQKPERQWPTSLKVVLSAFAIVYVGDSILWLVLSSLGQLALIYQLSFRFHVVVYPLIVIGFVLSLFWHARKGQYRFVHFAAIVIILLLDLLKYAVLRGLHPFYHGIFN